MNELCFEVEWEQVDGSRGDELAATWARLAIRVGGATITQVKDYRSYGLRDRILIPLYPLAEWIATHWWSLLYEVQAPGREGYERRHNLRFGREGFALPDLFIKPTGERALIEWRALELPEARVGFSAGGTRDLELASIRDSLSDLIETVLARLDQQGVTDTGLHQEWRAIQAADEAEAAFCRAAARLGQDPYDLSESEAGAILAAANRLPAGWQDDFFDVANARELEAQVALIDDARALLRRSPGPFDGLVALRGRTEKIDPHRTPWEQGYQVARTLRHRLDLGADPLNSDTALAEAFGIASLGCVSVNDSRGKRLFDAMVDTADGGRPGFLTTKSRPEQVRFAFCRGLFEYLTAPGTPSALVTVARTDRQKCNRAFAAEFLAPAEWLRERIDGSQVSPDEMDDWAQELGVSTVVVGHQIENHRLAEVAGF